MSKRRTKTIFSVFSLIYLITGVIAPAFAAQAYRNLQMPSQSRDQYTTDLFTGSAGYSYPIKLPKGTNDFTPNVSLSYNSAAVNDNSSLKGKGWDLNRDYIERDVNYTPANGSTSDDKFLLHFQGQVHELVYVAGDSRYHTKIESNLHITKLTTGEANDSNEYWQVITPDGTKYRFGQGTNSELMCNSRNYATRWNLDLAEDTHFNKIFYTYSESGGTSFLSKIEYNNEKSRVVDFTYTVNSTAFRAVYTQGCYISEGATLNDIKVKVNSSLVNQFDLSYSQSSNSAGLLNSITERVSSSSALPPTAFTYKPDATKWATQSGTPWINNASIDTHLGPGTNATTIDVNGDGFTDIVKSDGNGSNTWTVRKNNGGTSWYSGVSPEVWVNNYGMDAKLDRADTRLVDVTGDSLPDIVKMHNNSGMLTYRIYKNTGTYWNTTDNGYVGVYSGLNGADITTGTTEIMDVNGDSLADIVQTDTGTSGMWRVFKNLGGTWTSTPEEWTAPNGMNIGQANIRLMDVNGDGLPDVVRTLVISGTTVSWHVYKNTGSGWVQTGENWVEQVAIDAHLEKTNVILADANGDGLPDIIKTVANGSYHGDWWVYLNTGYKWDTTSPMPQNWISTSAQLDLHLYQADVRLVDVTGDGMTDIVKGQNNGGGYDTWQVWKNTAEAPLMLSSIKTPQGGTISFDYTPSTSFDQSGEDDLFDTPFPMWLLTRKTENNGMTNSHQTNDITNYEYYNGWYKWQDREFRGFQVVIEYGPGDSENHYVFRQDDARKGKIRESQYRNSASLPYAETEEEWSVATSSAVTTAKLDSEKQYTYDGTASNPKIIQTDYAYDSYGNVTKKSELGDTSINTDDRFTYNEYIASTSGWLVNLPKKTYLNAANDSTKVAESTFYYDNHAGNSDAPIKGDLTKEVRWLNGGTSPETTYAYDSFGNQTRVTNARNHTTTALYESTGTYATSSANAKNQITTMSYDLGTGNLLSKTDPNSQTTTYIYDAFGRILKEIQPYDNSTYPTKEYTYSFDGTAPESTLISQREVSTASGTLNAYTFIDGFGRKIQTRAEAEDSSKQIITDTFYDPIGEVNKETVPYLATLGSAYTTPVASTAATEITYGPLGRVTMVENPKGDTKTTAYDHWKVTDIDESGHIKRKFMNAFGKISMVQEVLNGADIDTEYSYDSRDLLTNIEDAPGNDFTFTYDSLGRKTQQVDPDMGTWNYTYDGVDNLITQTDNRSVTITKSYDELNRLTKTDYPSDTDSTFIYDGNGKRGTLTIATDSAGTVNYFYDNKLRKTKESRTVSGTTKSTEFTYDAADRQITQKNPDNEVITNTFNAQGEIETVSNLLSNLNYNALGKITKKQFANSLTTDYTYNSTDFRLGRIQTGSIQDLNYTYDNVGNVSTIADGITSKTQTFGYDDLDRLKIASESGGFNHSYTYNSIGNLTGFTSTNSAITYNYGANGKPHAVTSSNEMLASTSATQSIFTDLLAPGWTDASYNATNSIITTQSYSGTSAIQSTINADGGLDLQFSSGTSTNPYTHVQFAVKASGSGQQYEVYADTTYGVPLAAPVSLASYGGQPVSTGWRVYTIPLSALGATNVTLRDVVIHDMTSTNQAAIYVDDVKLVNQTSTSPTTIWDETLASGWTDASYNTTNIGTNTPANVYQGTWAIASTINADGGLDFQSVSGFNTAGYSAVRFALKSGSSNQQYEVYADTTYGVPLTTPVSLANYGGQPNTSGYKVYTIPLADLAAQNVSLKDIVIHDMTSTNQGVLYVDALQFIPTTSSYTPTYTYDANGNMTSDGNQCYTFNNANQMSQVRKCATGAVIANYIYDYNGNRMVKQNYINGTLSNTVTSWSDSYETKVVSGGSTENTAYYWVNGQLIGKKDNAGTRTYMHNDHLGSNALVTSAAGAVIETTKYDPWGEVLSGATKSKFAYTGQEMDGESKLHYYNARYYDPHIRRFTQPDPWIQDVYNPQSLNRYSYAQNNPLRYTDPSGYGILDFVKSVGSAISNAYNSVVNQVSNAAKSVASALAPKPPVQYLDPKNLPQNIKLNNNSTGGSVNKDSAIGSQTSGVGQAKGASSPLPAMYSPPSQNKSYSFDVAILAFSTRGIGGGGGMQFNNKVKVPYLAFGLGTPGIGSSLTYSGQNPQYNTTTLNLSVGARYFVYNASAEVDFDPFVIHFDQIDHSAGVGTRGVSLTINHTFAPDTFEKIKNRVFSD